ncbi:hypothetical protein Tco_0589476, partial [Tanacetum coccineum]
MVGFGGDDEGDDDGMMREMMRVEALLLWLPVGEGRRRVEGSDMGDRRIDRPTRSLFGLRRICPPEKFSGGGEWWPDNWGR